MIETANRIYNRSYTDFYEINNNGRQVLIFVGGNCKMTVLKSTFEADKERFEWRMKMMEGKVNINPLTQ